HRSAVRELEWLGVKSQRLFVRGDVVLVYAALECGASPRIPNPRVRRGRLYGGAMGVEEIQRAIGNVQLLDSVHHLTVCRACFYLADARRARQFRGGVAQRIVELTLELMPD